LKILKIVKELGFTLTQFSKQKTFSLLIMEMSIKVSQKLIKRIGSQFRKNINQSLVKKLFKKTTLLLQSKS